MDNELYKYSPIIHRPNLQWPGGRVWLATSDEIADRYFSQAYDAMVSSAGRTRVRR